MDGVDGLVVAYVSSARVTPTKMFKDKLVETGFFTRDSEGKYHPAMHTTSVFTKEQMESRVRFMGAKKVNREMPITAAQRVWTNSQGEFYIARLNEPDYDSAKVRIA